MNSVNASVNLVVGFPQHLQLIHEVFHPGRPPRCAPRVRTRTSPLFYLFLDAVFVLFSVGHSESRSIYYS